MTGTLERGPGAASGGEGEPRGGWWARYRLRGASWRMRGKGQAVRSFVVAGGCGELEGSHRDVPGLVGQPGKRQLRGLCGRKAKWMVEMSSNLHDRLKRVLRTICEDRPWALTSKRTERHSLGWLFVASSRKFNRNRRQERSDPEDRSKGLKSVAV